MLLHPAGTLADFGLLRSAAVSVVPVGEDAPCYAREDETREAHLVLQLGKEYVLRCVLSTIKQREQGVLRPSFVSQPFVPC